jgi:hypothetical protein
MLLLLQALINVFEAPGRTQTPYSLGKLVPERNRVESGVYGFSPLPVLL